MRLLETVISRKHYAKNACSDRDYILDSFFTRDLVLPHSELAFDVPGIESGLELDCPWPGGGRCLAGAGPSVEPINIKVIIA